MLSLLFSVTLYDFEANSEIIVDWKATYLNVSLDDNTPIQQGKNGKKLSSESECFAMAFERVLPVKNTNYRKTLVTAHNVKLPMGKFHKALFRARRYSLSQIRWDNYQQDALIPKWVNIYDHNIYTVWQIIKTVNSTPFLRLQQQLLSQQNQRLSGNQQPAPNVYTYNYNNFVNSQNNNNSHIQQELPDSSDSVSSGLPARLPSPSVSVSTKPHHQRKRLKRFLSKQYSKKTKYHRRLQRTKAICATTVRRAHERVKINHRTPILWSVKYEFCLRYEGSSGKSCRKIWQEMRAEGFNVGKSAAASQKWIHNGSKFYQNLIMKKGKDGYKLSLLSFLQRFHTNSPIHK